MFRSYPHAKRFVALVFAHHALVEQTVCQLYREALGENVKAQLTHPSQFREIIPYVPIRHPSCGDAPRCPVHHHGRDTYTQ